MNYSTFCAWCGCKVRTITLPPDTKPPEGKSHGICGACLAENFGISVRRDECGTGRIVGAAAKRREAA